MKNVEARYVGDGILDRCLFELALRQKEADFLELLSSRKKIALGGVGEKLQRLGRCALPLALETGSDPARQVGALQRKNFKRDTALLERGEPRGARRCSVESG